MGSANQSVCARVAGGDAAVMYWYVLSLSRRSFARFQLFCTTQVVNVYYIREKKLGPANRAAGDRFPFRNQATSRR